MNDIVKKENGHRPATFGSVVDQIFQNNLDRFFENDFWDTGRTQLGQVPVNIRETDKNYEIEAIAPGLKKEDFQLDITGDTLTISFNHKEEKTDEDKKEGWIKREYSQRAFTRSFHLDESIDAGKITAVYQEGILKLQLPKKENAQKVARNIQVK